MRLSTLTAHGAFVAAAWTLAAPVPVFADFSAGGRRTKPRPASRPEAVAPAPRTTPVGEPRGDALIKRYTGIVLSQPGAPFPLQRLAQLYRERDGNLDQLISELERRLTGAGEDTWSLRIALGGIYQQAGQADRAEEALARAATERPNSPVPLMALGHLRLGRSNPAGAREQFEAALIRLKNAAEQEQTRRTLLGLSLDLGDYDAAKRHHTSLVKSAKGSFFVRAELGRELLLRNDFARAETEFRDLVTHATGDNRALAPALRDLGRALAGQKKRTEALEVLKRALAAAGGTSGLRREIFETTVEIYRAEDRLPELVTLLEAERASDFDRLRLLGELYEETGRVADALKTYKRALGREPNDIGVRLKTVQLLQIQGELDAAIVEYQRLIKAAPHNPDFAFALAEALLQSGNRDGALRQLEQLEQRGQGDDQTQAALVDFYERVDEKDRALALLERLADKRGGDPTHLVELGNRYYEQGDTERAKRMWQRLPQVVPDRARALRMLGEVYLEHDLTTEAVAALESAMKLEPGQSAHKKAYALGLERMGAAAGQSAKRKFFEDALAVWEELLRDASSDEHLKSEARQHIVTLWSLSGVLRERIPPLERRLKLSPPDLDAGRLLAQTYLRMRRHADAERTLQRIIEHAPGDVPSLLALERALVLGRKLEAALGVLERLVQAEPKRAREYYQRMAQFAAELYRDDDAVRFAAKAVELSPDDAEGHRKLGEMYLRRQDAGRAAAEFRRAITKNDRLFRVYFELAELLLNQQDVEGADALLRRVVRACPDEQLVQRAARLSMQLNVGRGTLESLERELLPVALGNPTRPMYRRLLVEIYGAMTFPLVQEAASPDPDTRAVAHERLAKIGKRAVKPLLDALGDARDAQQRVAIELLSHVGNVSAGPALVAFASSDAEPELRARAMIAAGTLDDGDVVSRLKERLVPGGHPTADQSDPVTMAAVWAVARLKRPEASRVLTALVDSEAPAIRALAILGLGVRRDRQLVKTAQRVLEDPRMGNLTRAAAAQAIGRVGNRDHATELVHTARSPDTLLSTTSLVALARLGAPEANAVIADALLDPDPDRRNAATLAAQLLVTPHAPEPEEPFPRPNGEVDVESLLLHQRPTHFEPDAGPRALSRLETELLTASIAAAQNSPERAQVLADALLSRSPHRGFGGLTAALADAAPETKKRALATIERIERAVLVPFVALSGHPSASVRAVALAFLATVEDPEATRALIAAVDDPSEQVQRAAIGAIAESGQAGALPALYALLTPEVEWAVRRRAVAAIGAIGVHVADPTLTALVERLANVARTDRFSVVREAATRALARTGAPEARTALERVAREDPEARVQQLARELLKGATP